MKIFCNSKWGANYKSLLQLYRGFVRAKLDYGCVVYGSASESSLKTLDTIHHQGVRLALGAFKSSPIPSILSEAGEPPLSIRRQILTCNYLINLQRDPRHIHYSILENDNLSRVYARKSGFEKPLRYRSKAILDKANVTINSLNCYTSPSLPAPWIVKRPQVCYDLLKFDKKKDMHQEIRNAFQELIVERFSDSKLVYTDGSKTDDSIAAAFYSQDFKFSTKLNPMLSICNAELSAIWYAVNFILTVFSSIALDCTFLICCDSLSALQSLQDVYSLNPIAAEIRKLLLDSKIQFIWIPSHIGIAGNEEADRLAREELSSNSPVNGKIPLKDVKNLLKKKVTSSWNFEWTHLTNNKLRKIKHENKPWHPPQEWSRRDQVSLSRLRIGHTNFTHVYLMKKENPPLFSFIIDENITLVCSVQFHY
uniref:RNase H type-1 domain-containing protein n=1 Tax=Cacopsylla melanoneura TaxID=428564 RepID=A0A8D8X716_9HEMI